jgi:tetratricopeptide (TPR) repeat protein
VGCKIAVHVKRMLVPLVSVPGAQILLDGGHPGASRDYANRALRVAGLSLKERLQLELIVASSFAEEGKVDKAIKSLEKIGPSLTDTELTVADKANFFSRSGRLHYFTGCYADAAKAFQEAAPLFIELKDWETAARTWFNAGACVQNSGVGSNVEAFRMVEECRRIAMDHDLKGPMSSCHSFYGFEAYHAGNFAGARDHFRRALTVIPANDKSFRRLHIMSMLCIIYFASGKYALAKRFVRQTVDLASLDESERFKVRYKALDAERMWEDGLVEESQQLMAGVVAPMLENGVHTLEDLSALSRFVTQSAICGSYQNIDRFKISEQLKKNKITWLEFEYAKTILRGNSLSSCDLRHDLEKLLTTSRELGASHYVAMCQLGIVRTFLRDRNLEEVKNRITDLEISVSRLGDAPMKAKLMCVIAGIAYQEGDFQKCTHILSSVEKSACMSFPDLFSVQSCLATIKGQSPRLHNDWQTAMVARFVRSYFSPTLSSPEPGLFVVSGHYTVSLVKHPMLADLLNYLTVHPATGSSPEDIQVSVWKQSVNTQGWQQKIRNSIMRLRDLFPYSMAPIVLHDSGCVRFFSAAIGLKTFDDSRDTTELLAIRTLTEGPLSSQQIAERMNISLATAKRAVKKLTETNEICSEKSGRNIVYRIVGVRKGTHSPEARH